MKGVILAGGRGTRLRPLTLVINKHLLPVGDRVMVIRPLETLKNLGIKDICVVTGSEHVEDFKKLLGSGETLGVKISYRAQPEPKGIADALLKAEDFFGEEKAVAILGDNIFEGVMVPEEAFSDENAYIFIKEIENPAQFGVAVIGAGGGITSLVEKPDKAISNMAVTGLYIYPRDVFDAIRTLKPSARGELEITDINNIYLKRGLLKAVTLEGAWADAGTFPSLIKENMRIAHQTSLKSE